MGGTNTNYTNFSAKEFATFSNTLITTISMMRSMFMMIMIERLKTLSNLEYILLMGTFLTVTAILIGYVVKYCCYSTKSRGGFFFENAKTFQLVLNSLNFQVKLKSRCDVSGQGTGQE